MLDPALSIASSSVPARPRPSGALSPATPDLSFEPTADLPVVKAETPAFTTVELQARESAAPPVPVQAPADEPPATPLPSTSVTPAPETHEESIGPGTVLRARYQLERLIGVGGSALVFQATDLHRLNAGSPDPFVAVKVLKPELRADPVAETRLKREFLRLEALSHPHIARALDLDRDRQSWFIVLELLEGASLATRLGRLGTVPLPRQEALRIITACGEALDFAHRRGQLHLDFKPGNVFLTQTEEIRIFDLGAGYDDYTTASRHARPVPQQATPAYASPEILAGEAPNVRDDVFSFGVVIHELLTGVRPAAGTDASTGRPAGISRQQWTMLHRALAPTRAQRPASVAELVNAFTTPPPRRWTGSALLSLAAAGGAYLAVQGIVTTPEPAARSDSRQATLAVPLTSVLGDAKIALFNADTPPPAAPPVPEPVAAPAPQPQRALRPAFIVSDPATVIVTRPTNLAAVILRREAGEGPARPAALQWKTVPGSAAAGIDYEAVESGTVRFADNQDVSALYVRLPQTAGRGNRSFFVELTSETRGVAIQDSASRIEVIIRDP